MSCFVQIFFFSLSSSFFSLAFPACVLLLFKKGNVHKVLSFYSFTTVIMRRNKEFYEPKSAVGKEGGEEEKRLLRTLSTIIFDGFTFSTRISGKFLRSIVTFSFGVYFYFFQGSEIVTSNHLHVIQIFSILFFFIQSRSHCCSSLVDTHTKKHIIQF